MAYSIPPGDKVPFVFDGTVYTIPPGQSVALRFGGAPGTLFVVGWDASVLGTASVINVTQQIFPAGWDSAFVNGNVVLTKSVLLPGIPPIGFGTTHLFNLTQEIRPTGLNAFVGFGTAWVSLSTRRLTTVGLGDQSRFGTLSLAGGVRTVDMAGRGIPAIGFGAATLTFRVREMFPLWFIATSYGTPFVDFKHFVDPVGFGGESMGQPEVFRPRFIVDLQGLGIRGPLWGDNEVDLHLQYVAPPGWIGGGPTGPEAFGRAELYNLRQYVNQLFDVTPSDGGVFGNFNLVENYIKTIAPEGNAGLRMGVVEVKNNARIVTTPPFIDFTLWGDTLVAYAIRTILPVGSDTSQWGSVLGNIVYNGARVLAPAAWRDGTTGTPERVWSNLQRIKLQGFDQAEYGLPMVAFAIRTVTPFPMPDPPPLGAVVVQNWVRPIAPVGYTPNYVFGNHTLEQHFTIVVPSSILPPSNAIGDPRVFNVTPEIPIFGWTATEWGRPAVHNQFETFAFQSFGGETFGHHVVKDRRQTAQPNGIAPLPISQKHQVRNVIPDPPAARTLGFTGFDMLGLGLPAIFHNSLVPLGWGPDEFFGSATLRSNGILPRGITPPYSPDTGVQCGVPSINGPLNCFPRGIDPADKISTPLPDIGPRYVWAPMGYPYKTGFWVELLSVTLRIRTINVRGFEFFLAGTPHLGLDPQHLNFQGTKFQKFGFPVLNGGGGLVTSGLVQTVFGTTAVNHAEDLEPRTIHPVGLAATLTSSQDVQNFNRALIIDGFNAFTISAPTAPVWPRTSLWVSNAYPPFPVSGFDALRFGTAWVSNYRRFLDVAGWTSEVVATDSPGQFADRMRVRKQTVISAAGITAAGACGTPTIDHWTHHLASSGLLAPPMGRPVVRQQFRLNLEGWDSSVIGDVQRWEAGKVKPHGDELAAYGRAVIARAISPTGLAGAVGTPRFWRPWVPTMPMCRCRPLSRAGAATRHLPPRGPTSVCSAPRPSHRTPCHEEIHSVGPVAPGHRQRVRSHVGEGRR